MIRCERLRNQREKEDKKDKKEKKRKKKEKKRKKKKKKKEKLYTLRNRLFNRYLEPFGRLASIEDSAPELRNLKIC